MLRKASEAVSEGNVPIPKTGRRGGDLVNRLDQKSYFAWI